MLQGRYGVPTGKLCLAPFFVRPGQQPGAARRACAQASLPAALLCGGLWACRQPSCGAIAALSALSQRSKNAHSM